MRRSDSTLTWYSTKEDKFSLSTHPLSRVLRNIRQSPNGRGYVSIISTLSAAIAVWWDLPRGKYRVVVRWRQVARLALLMISHRPRWAAFRKQTTSSWINNVVARTRNAAMDTLSSFSEKPRKRGPTFWHCGRSSWHLMRRALQRAQPMLVLAGGLRLSLELQIPRRRFNYEEVHGEWELKNSVCLLCKLHHRKPSSVLASCRHTKLVEAFCVWSCQFHDNTATASYDCKSLQARPGARQQPSELRPLLSRLCGLKSSNYLNACIAQKELLYCGLTQHLSG